ncbi:hypothetical protein P692DRAFT_20869865 [Suillus brevipes Sb2]|nr:hypothetical protein P692DRAFT_20869865 [Suillus brevipes Sb2]
MPSFGRPLPPPGFSLIQHGGMYCHPLVALFPLPTIHPHRRATLLSSPSLLALSPASPSRLKPYLTWRRATLLSSPSLLALSPASPSRLKPYSTWRYVLPSLGRPLPPPDYPPSQARNTALLPLATRPPFLPLPPPDYLPLQACNGFYCCTSAALRSLQVHSR